MQVNIKTLIDDVQYYDTVRELRWPEGRECPFCDSKQVIKRGFGEKDLANVRQVTIKPLIKATVLPGSMICIDEYGIYNRLDEWGYGHKNVNHGAREFARDEDGDGFCEVHVNTMEGFWSLLRGWLRPHRGISQEKLPLYLGFFEFVHNSGKRGKALLHSLVELLVN